MKQLLKISITIFVISFFISCDNNDLSREIRVVNDAFMTVVDTVAYYELSLRPAAPPDYFEKSMIVHYSNPLYKHLAIVVPDTLYSFTDDIWLSSLKIHCKGWDSNENISIIELRKQMCKIIEEGTAPQKFNIKHLSDIGRYILVNGKSDLKSAIPIVGKVQFSQVVINKEASLAVFAAIISDGGKLMIEKLFILSKEGGKWRVIKTEILAVS